ncbi:hypothetical protein SAMN05444920_109266 [Nonomuraea solani]|uniref:Uncharacterized protein n=1 Tax=Nonomuraea solani TaxID=1144553 RepID=A0A1H6EE15_9ACTN|nr:hypothetical protein SAMN05444920_109266 [Nonomuraea solani]
MRTFKEYTAAGGAKLQLRMDKYKGDDLMWLKAIS